ncbi:hypothetical protein B9T10_07730 [Wohlfahrtiimonas chitiniclastica]|uniref:response regulator n=1 Tax=Wohlfahrtiimonas chitiniclastica TaxID=400946 RepID=UPI000B999C15|nr:response regulator [Wohlfahrtiimonas chitiniclastica]MBS7834002.1 response regulator [Wohlfahrtiimonas chitiniclastica]OYQ87941.1 hypothetical protein B9T10_07730 [Wohlfahrtiimonas chitiniclastica]
MLKSKMTVLCVDDEVLILNALKALLRLRYHVITTTDPFEAIEILKTTKVAVIISDQRMPEMLGTELLSQAKILSPRTTRILLTGFSDLSAIISTVNDSEVYRFLTKPWSNQEVLEIVADAVNVSKAIAAAPVKVPEKTYAQPQTPAYVIYKSSAAGLRELDIHAELPEHTHALVAHSNEEVIALLQQYPVTLIIVYFQLANEADIELLKYLKRELPELLSIGLVKHADYQDIIMLINEAKLYRYVMMPSRPRQIAFFVKSAIEMFEQFKASPSLLTQQQVMSKTPIKSSLLGLLSGVKRFFTK